MVGIKVDLGCGSHKPRGFIGIDCVAGAEVDLVADLTERFPFEDNSVGYVRAHDAIEHWPDRLHTMNEIWRICHDGALVDIRVPSTDGRGAFQDPTHVSFWNRNSFYYYCIEYPAFLSLCQKYGFKGCFKLLELEDVQQSDKVVHVHVRLQAVKPWAAEPKKMPMTRLEMAQHLISLDNKRLADFAAGPLVQNYADLVSESRIEEPLSSAEQRFLALVKPICCIREESVRPVTYQLAALLFCRPFELLPRFYLADLPLPLAKVYVGTMCRPPRLFLEIGEAEKHANFMAAWINYIHGNIIKGLDQPLWRLVAQFFAERANMMALYFTDRNLREVYQKRGEIIDLALRSAGWPLDHEPSPKVSGEPIRLGIVIGSFAPRPESFAALPVFEHADSDFEIFLYVQAYSGHSFEEYCRARSKEFKVLPREPRQQIEMIRKDSLDLLFFAGNLTAVTHSMVLIAAHRVARVQVCSVGSVTTTGLRNVDYFVTSSANERAFNPEKQYTERLAYLPGLAHCFSYGSESPKTSTAITRESLGVSEGVLFASVANMHKIIPEVQECWVDILRRCNNSYLLLFPFGNNWSADYPKKFFMQSLHDRLDAFGVPRQRLIVIDRPDLNRHDIREHLSVCDVYLDTFPFSGSTSFIEPLEVGLPIVTFPGQTFRSAMGATMLNDVGLCDLITVSKADYTDLACRLAGDVKFRKALRRQITDVMNENPSFLDSRAYGAAIQDLFRKLCSLP